MHSKTIVARLHLYPPDHCAGAEMMVHTMLRALVDRGHRCEVWLSHISKTRAPYVLDGVHIFPAAHRGDLPKALAKSDAILTHLDNTTAAISLAIRHRKPLIQVMHNTFPPSVMWSNCKADLIVFNSEWMADAFGRHPNEIVIRPPIRAEDYRTSAGHAVTLINLTDAKGGTLFWELAERMPDVEFIAVKGGYGKQIVRQLPNVQVVPHGMRMRDVYAATRVLLMPSEYESWGRTGSEAMVSGIPVVAHPTPGLKENLDYAGIFLDRDDPAAWEAKIRELLSAGEAYETASSAAFKRAAEQDPTTDLTAWCNAVEALA